MRNKFDILMEQAAQHQYTKSCSVGEWSFEPNCAGNFAVVHNGEAVVTCENGQISDAKWGSRITDIEVHYILSSLIARIPNIQLDIMSVRTEDCLDVFGYDGPSSRIADIPGLEDIDYYRAWVTTKENASNPEKSDYVVYWDQGNTWCEVLAVFEGVSHEEFVVALHNKYQEWIQEDQSYEDRCKPSISHDLSSLDAIISAAEKSINKQSLSNDISSNTFEIKTERGGKTYMSKLWQIPVTWEMCGVVSIEADTLEDAINRTESDDSIELPSGEYVDSSFEVSFDDPDYIREFYNNNQADTLANKGYSTYGIECKTSLSSQIQSASTRAADTHTFDTVPEKEFSPKH